MTTILLLGSGELGKELTISAQRLGINVIAVDKYENAPAMQVADSFEVIDMLDANELERIVKKHRPKIIVPEIEAIRTEKLFEFEKNGIQVVPSAHAVNYTMNRRAIRDLAAQELKLKTAKYAYAKTFEELSKVAEDVGFPSVIKPLMSSSGKGQSTVKHKKDLKKAWDYALEGARGDQIEVIIEEFIPFESEITLLTVTQKEGPTLFCQPIGHRQERGDYQESWQPAAISENLLLKAQSMADKVTQALGGAGLWGVEFFLSGEQVYFSELSPRPHDTGMVTLANCQNLNEFELHLRAILGLPIQNIVQLKSAANAVILAKEECHHAPAYSNLQEALDHKNSELRIFGKPDCRPYRRMGIGLTYGDPNESMDSVRKRAKAVADTVTLAYKND